MKFGKDINVIQNHVKTFDKPYKIVYTVGRQQSIFEYAL